MSDAEAGRTPILVRFPASVLEQVDAYVARTAPDHRAGSRNAAILVLVERGLADVTRPRVSRDKARAR